MARAVQLFMDYHSSNSYLLLHGHRQTCSSKRQTSAVFCFGCVKTQLTYRGSSLWILAKTFATWTNFLACELRALHQIPAMKPKVLVKSFLKFPHTDHDRLYQRILYAPIWITGTETAIFELQAPYDSEVSGGHQYVRCDVVRVGHVGQTCQRRKNHSEPTTGERNYKDNALSHPCIRKWYPPTIVYGSAKLHKDGDNPSRKIVSTIGLSKCKITMRINSVLAPYALQANV